MRTHLASAALAAGLALSISAPVAHAQKALVYCPVGVDASGCDRIVSALQSKFPDGVDRGYDGSNGTVDLKAIDLEHYSVFIVPSLADDDTKQPYGVLRAAAGRLHLAINGRVAVYSGAPDQGSANRADKDAIIQNLAAWASAGHTRATSLVGMVALLDLSSDASARYAWVRSISLADVSADAELQSFGDVTPISTRNDDALLAGGAARRFTNMASYGLHIGAHAAARTEIGAIGGTSAGESGAQSVLVLYSNVDGSGGAKGGAALNKAPSGGASFDASGGGGSGPTLTTDKPDYLPGDTVLFTGTGWAPGDTVTITIHEDPQWSNPDRTVSAVADGTGNLSSHAFVVDQRDYGVTFTATAVGNPSGLVAQTTFTDGNVSSVSTAVLSTSATPNTCGSGTPSLFVVGVEYCGQAVVTAGNFNGSVDLYLRWVRPDGTATCLSNQINNVVLNGTYVQKCTPDVPSTASADWHFQVGTAANFSGGNLLASVAVHVVLNTPPVANNDSYTTNEDTPLTVAANGVLGNDTDAENNTLHAVRPAGSTGPSHGSLSLNDDGSFTYTPDANYNGPDAFTYKAFDGFVNSTAFATVNITVNPVNDAPSFTKGADQTVLEDAGAQTVANWATAISAGPANESGQTVNFVIVSNDNTALFSAQPAVAANGTLTYTPAANANGSANITIHIHDDGGTANGGVDTGPDLTFKINVTAVNDAPSFTKGADQTVLEDAGAQTVTNWATAISAGPPDEASQTLTFVVTSNSNLGLFSTGPAVSPTGTLTYTPAANANGSATIKLKITDNGGTANGGVDASTEQTFVINVTAVNDAPSFTKGADPTVNEDAGAQTVVGWATAISAGPPDESGQTLTFHVTNNTNTALFSVQPSIAANGTLTYTAAPDANGTATITLTLQDNGGTANGGVDTSPPVMFVITVNPVNDVPSFSKGADQTVNEDAGPQSVPGWATNISAGPANESSQIIDFIVTNDNNTLFSSQPVIDASGKLTYTSAPNANGSATVTVKVHDNGGTANGGVDTSLPQTFTITVNPVNDAPGFTKGADQTVNEDAGAQTVMAWATNISAGPADESGQTLTFQVSNDNSALFLVQPTIDATGKLTYTSAPDANGVAHLTVTLKDNGGTANGGVDTSPQQMFMITVNPVNDPPSFTKGADQTKLEDAGPQTVSGWATAISSGPANESSQTVSFMVTGNTNTGLFASGPTVASDGTLSYTTAPDANGSATITIVAKDNGGTANGGVDTSDPQTFTITITPVNDPPTFDLVGNQSILEDAGAQTVTNALTNKSPGPPNESSQTLSITVTNDKNGLFSVQPSIDLSTGTLTYTTAPNANGSATVTVTLMDNGGTANGGSDHTTKTFMINVTPVNDAPSFTKGADQTTLEDAGAQTVNGWATSISAGPPDEASQVLNFIVTNDNNALFSSQPAVSPSGQLTYTAAPNANGVAHLTIKLHDNGGTDNSGVDTSDPQMFTITITAVNDAPTFDLIGNQSVLEDAGPQSVSNAVTNKSAGPPDEQATQTLTLTVSNDNNPLFSAQPAIDASGTLTYTPAANANGTATVTVKLQDNGGTANGGVDLTSKTFVITVTAVNDAPSFTKGTDQTVLEDAGAQTVSGWATAISAGPPDESGQTLTFIVTNNTNPGLFSAGPSISATGVLTYTPAPNANGSATLTLHLHDDGGTANGGVDNSPDQTFTINVTPVNDAPTFNLIGNQTVLEDAGAQTVLSAVTNPSPGPANESGQSLTLTVTNDNNALFSSQPAIDASGTLTYTSAPNANGSAVVKVKLQDNGGIANGGVDATTKTFTIYVTPVNDPPVITAFSGPLLPTALGGAVSATGTFTDPDLGDVPLTDSHTGTIDWGDGNTSAVTIAAGSGTSRNFSGSHTYSATGVYTITAHIKDSGNLTSDAIYQYVVIYDPSAGFVTGGGWINSPTGAYVANPSLSGKATFGFVSKYKKGQTTPDGNTEFDFHAAGFNFQSTSYDWLVISGTKAQYKGSGSINGSGDYFFMLTAIDGDLKSKGSPDTFRIKVWDKVTLAVIYDNQITSDDTADPTTMLGGGSIQIHN